MCSFFVTCLHGCFFYLPSWAIHVSYLSQALKLFSFVSVVMSSINHSFYLFILSLLLKKFIRTETQEPTVCHLSKVNSRINLPIFVCGLCKIIT